MFPSSELSCQRNIATQENKVHILYWYQW